MTVVLALLLLGQAGAPQQPARDTLASRTAAGDAQVTGTIVDDTGAPIERAHVLLVGESADASRTAVTAADGRFAMEGLPAGHFTLTVSKPGFPFRVFGQPGVGMRGTVIRLAHSQRFTANVTLPRGCAVAGIVLDQEGVPLPSARVTAYRASSRNGNPSFEAVGFTVADSRGRYRIFGAPAGELLLGVPLPRAESSGPPPGAVKVSLTAGEQRLGIDLRQAEADAVGRLHVTLAIPAGMMARDYQVSLVPDNAQSSRNEYKRVETFDVRDLAPGTYELLVDARLSEADAGPRARGRRHWAGARVTIEADRTTETYLTLQRAITMSGRLVFEGSTPPPANLSKAYWRLAPTDPVLARRGSTSADGRIDTSGGFTAGEALPGTYTVDHNVFAGWHLKGIHVEGTDRTDGGIVVDGGRDIGGIVVTFTDRVTEWRGTVRDAAGAPVPGYALVVYPENDRLWFPRRIAMSQPASDGAFVVRRLPPGSYNVAAVAAVDADQWLDPAFLKTLRPVMSIALYEGQVVSRDLLLRAPQ